MALTPEQEQELQQHLQQGQQKPGIMDRIRKYAMGHNGLGAGDVQEADAANNVDIPPAQPPVQHFDDGGEVMDLAKRFPAPTMDAPVIPPSSFDVNTQGPNMDSTLKMGGALATPPPAPPVAADQPSHGASGSWEPEPNVVPQSPQAPLAAHKPVIDSNPKSTNPKVESAHPGFDQDALEKYLTDEKGQMDKFGAQHMADSMKDLHDEQNGWKSSIGRRMAGASDAIMQGVARAGNSGNLAAYDARQARNQAENDKELGQLNTTNMEDIKAKQGLDQQSSHNALGASLASAIMPILQKLYPKASPDELNTMARNPAVAEGLLPNEEKLRGHEVAAEANKANHALSLEMAKMRMGNSDDKGYMTRLQKDTTQFTHDPNVVKAQGTLDKLGAATGLIEAGNVNNATAKQALQTAMTFVATGGQRVNETEMKQLGGAHTLTNRMNQWAKGLNDGTLTPKDYHDMKQVLDIYKTAAQRSLEDAGGRYANIRAQREGVDAGTARRELGLGEAPAAVAQPHPQDSAAMQWAQQNPTDPRAIRIMKANGR